MKRISYLSLLLCFMACSTGGDRKAEDQTKPDEESVSPNQVITEEEQNRKDSTTTDVFGQDTAAQKVGR